MRSELRYAFRGLCRKPAFALTAVTAIALGIGVATAVFSVVDPILFRPLPYTDEAHLVSVGMLGPAHIDTQEFMFGRPYVTWHDVDTPFQKLTSWSGSADCDLTETNPKTLSCARVEANFLSTLGVSMHLGRDFNREDDLPNAPKVALLSFDFWKTQFGNDLQVTGKTISLNGDPVRVIGVLPANYELPTLVRADVLLPQALDEAVQRSAETGRLLWAFARLKPGVTPERAETEMTPILKRSLDHFPSARDKVKMRVRSLRDRQTHDAQLAAWVLFGSVGAVLLIACANVANLLLLRAAGRQREYAVRSALGAGRLRLIRESLAESLFLGLIGGSGGFLLASGLISLFVGIAPDGIPRLQEAHLDLRVLLFSLGVSLLSSLLFALLPALQSPHAEALVGQRVRGRARPYLRQALVASQIAVSLILLAGATLLLRTLWNLQTVPLGIHTEGVLTAGIMLNRQRYPQPADQERFFSSVEEKLRQMPGVTALAVTDSLPPLTPSRTRPLYAMGAEGLPKFTDPALVGWRYVSPDYFSFFGIPIVRGRSFSSGDRTVTDSEIVISESLARRLFPSSDALSHRLNGTQVIGIAADVRNSALSDPIHPEYYLVRKRNLPSSQGDLERSAYFTLRSSLDTASLATQVRQQIALVDPLQTVAIETLNQRVNRLLDRPRFNAMLLLLFAVIGLALAAIGLYGVTAFMVAQRTSEIGIRIALGATRRQMVTFMLSSAAVWGLVGAVAGSMGSVYLSRYLGSLLFQVPPGDPWSLGIAAAVLLIVTLLASGIPSRRAASVDPVIALRHE